MITSTASRFSDLENIAVGETMSIRRTITAAAVDSFATLSGDDNPLHLDESYAQSAGFSGRVSHGALLVAYLSALVGTKLPGHGCLWMRQQLQWRAPVYIGDEIEMQGTVKHKSIGTRTLVLTIEARNQSGAVVMNGEGVVAVPGRQEGGPK
jgi:3-hydroxybutyryl-CoA dehydratase